MAVDDKVKGSRAARTPHGRLLRREGRVAESAAVKVRPPVKAGEAAEDDEHKIVAGDELEVGICAVSRMARERKEGEAELVAA